MMSDEADGMEGMIMTMVFHRKLQLWLNCVARKRGRHGPCRAPSTAGMDAHALALVDKVAFAFVVMAGVVIGGKEAVMIMITVQTFQVMQVQVQM